MISELTRYVSEVAAQESSHLNLPLDMRCSSSTTILPAVSSMSPTTMKALSEAQNIQS